MLLMISTALERQKIQSQIKFNAQLNVVYQQYWVGKPFRLSGELDLL